MIYLDHNATTPPLPGVADAVAQASKEFFGNPSSLHAAGRKARHLLESSREQIAGLLKVKRQELVFTSGGSESNNTVLLQLIYRNRPLRLITSKIEHPSILQTVSHLTSLQGISADWLEVDPQGQVDASSLSPLIQPDTALISVMSANNETGALQPISEMAKIAQSHGIPFHTDAVQVLGKWNQDWNALGITYASAAAHKIGGPRGIGLLYVREKHPFIPLIHGGAQERMMRAGTENAVLAHGFALALDWYQSHQQTLLFHWNQWKAQLSQCVLKLPEDLSMGAFQKVFQTPLILVFRALQGILCAFC